MRSRSWLILGAALVALLGGLAAGRWLSGDETEALRASSGAAPARRGPGAELRPPGDLPARSDGRQSRAAQGADGDDARGSQPLSAAGRGSRGPSTDVSVSESPPKGGLGVDAGEAAEAMWNMDAELRARYRSEDFDAFGDGPVARDPVATRAPSDETASDDCLPLGAQGCRRDVDCCGVGVCRTRAGEIAGFLQCSEAN